MNRKHSRATFGRKYHDRRVYRAIRALRYTENLSESINEFVNASMARAGVR